MAQYSDDVDQVLASDEGNLPLAFTLDPQIIKDLELVSYLLGLTATINLS